MKYLKFLFILVFSIVIGTVNISFADITATFSYEELKDSTLDSADKHHYRYSNDARNIKRHDGYRSSCSTCGGATGKQRGESLSHAFSVYLKHNNDNVDKVGLFVGETTNHAIKAWRRELKANGYITEIDTYKNYQTKDPVYVKWAANASKLWKSISGYGDASVRNDIEMNYEAYEGITIEKISYRRVEGSDVYVICDNDHNFPAFEVVVNIVYTVEQEPETYDLTLLPNPSNGGTVNRNIQGPYEEGTNVKIWATPNTGFEFDAWTVNTSDIVHSQYAESDINMKEDITLVANFVRQKYTLTTTVDPTGSGTVSRSGGNPDADGKYVYGSQVTLTAKPKNSTYQFGGWEIPSGVSSSYPDSNDPTKVVITMPASNITVRAKFQQNKYTLTTNVEPNGSGTVSRSGGNPDTNGKYVYNSEVFLTATPKDDTYRFIGWEVTAGGDNTLLTSPTSEITVLTIPASNVTVKAKFQRIYYTLTLKVELNGAENSEIADTCSTPTPHLANNQYIKGTTVKFGLKNIKPDYVFKHWKENGVIKPDYSMNNQSIPLNQNTVLTAVFEKSTHAHFWHRGDDESWKNEISFIEGEPGYCETVEGGSSYKDPVKQINPEHCSYIKNLDSNNLQKYLYYIGEPISFKGDLCTCTTALSYIIHCNIIRDSIENGVKIGTYTCPATSQESLGLPPEGLKTFDVKIIVEGVNLVDGSGKSITSGKILTEATWQKTKWYVAGWNKDAGYSDELGTHYGTITIESQCPRKCSRTAYIPGPKPNPKLYNSKLIVKINPEGAGSAKVTYSYVDSGNTIRNTTATITQNTELSVLENSTVSIIAADGQTYRYINTTNGDNAIHEKKAEADYLYTVNAPPKGGTKTISVNFGRPNLYVTSTEGGSAYITLPTDYKNKTTINDVPIAKHITIVCKEEEGYKFLRWEYDREVEKEEFVLSTEIIMPGYDLTVKAVFEKAKEGEEDVGYKLYADVNNPDFGKAWISLGEEELTETSAISGSKYTISWEEEANCEFESISYEYTAYGDKPSPIISLNKDTRTAVVEMVKDSDLRITINFKIRSIPPPDTLLYNVDYIAAPEKGGTVPNDRKAYEGEELPLIATPNDGYMLSGWRFENANGVKIYPTVNLDDETKQGHFIMPGYAVRVIAEFIKVPTYRDVTVIIVGPGSGKVTVNGEEITSGSVINGMDGSSLKFEATPDDGSIFGRYTDGDGKKLSEEEIYSHIISGDITIVIKFEIENNDDKGPYTLYVSSLYGGNAEIVGFSEDNKGKYTSKDIKPIGPDELGKTVYKLENVYAGDVFKIAYEVTEEGYEFGFWEYKPHISPDAEENNGATGEITITMPYSDLTITAVFKNDNVKLEPKLSVTTNNPEWGSAWTFVEEEQTVHDKKYDVKLGDRYTLEYEAKPGYYFVNWTYSTTETPFISKDNIIIPAMDLEVMAMFSPIPEGETEDPTPKPEDPEDPTTDPTGHEIDFVARPEEGGRVPDDLENIFPGSEVTIAVTVNKGWEFDKWIFKTPDGVEVFPDVEYDPITGTGSFIMPDYPIKAIAVFREKDYYTLYITHYYGGDAWTYDNDGTTKTTVVEKAYVGCAYPIEYTVDPKYEFVDWEFRWDKHGDELNPDDINPIIGKDRGIAIMPRSDMTVTAVFREKEVTGSPMVRVSTNNTLWGDAWIVIDGTEYHWKDLINDPSKQWLNATAGEFYDVYFKAEDGFEFTNWSTTDYFPNISEDWDEYIEDFDYSKYFKTVLKMPDEKIEIMAFFKPGDEEQPKFTLKVEADPEEGGTVSIGGKTATELKDIYATQEVKIKATANSEYEFKEWYYEVKDENGDKQRVIFSRSEEKTFRMPPKDLTLIAEFDKIPEEEEDDETGGGTNPNYYDIVIKKDGDGSGTITVGRENIYVRASDTDIIKTLKVEDGKQISLGVTTDINTDFEGWYSQSETLLSANSNYTVTVNGKDIVIIVRLDGNNEPGEDKDKDKDKVADSFKIVSVRDLNWMDYFIENGKLNPDRYFSISDSTTETDTMLHDRGDFKQPIKMGYAVEFELITTGISENIENLELRIEPKLYEAKDGERINTRDEINLFNSYGTKLMGSFDKIEKYQKITIKKNSNGTYPNGSGNFMEYMKPNDNDMIPGRNISENEILWRWVYYLPADTYIPKTQRTGNEIIVDFDIGLYINGEKKKDIVLNAKDTFKQKWSGYVFRYSLDESLLDDIYDNAQN